MPLDRRVVAPESSAAITNLRKIAQVVMKTNAVLTGSVKYFQLS